MPLKCVQSCWSIHSVQEKGMNGPWIGHLVGLWSGRACGCLCWWRRRARWEWWWRTCLMASLRMCTRHAITLLHIALLHLHRRQRSFKFIARNCLISAIHWTRRLLDADAAVVADAWSLFRNAQVERLFWLTFIVRGRFILWFFLLCIHRPGEGEQKREKKKKKRNVNEIVWKTAQRKEILQ